MTLNKPQYTDLQSVGFIEIVNSWDKKFANQKLDFKSNFILQKANKFSSAIVIVKA